MTDEDAARAIYGHHRRAKLKRSKFPVPEWHELGQGERKLRIAAVGRLGYYRGDATESRIDR